MLLRGEVNPVWGSRSESESEEGGESRGADPKRSDLPMARVKRG